MPDVDVHSSSFIDEGTLVLDRLIEQDVSGHLNNGYSYLAGPVFWTDARGVTRVTIVYTKPKGN